MDENSNQTKLLLQAFFDFRNQGLLLAKNIKSKENYHLSWSNYTDFSQFPNLENTYELNHGFYLDCGAIGRIGWSIHLIWNDFWHVIGHSTFSFPEEPYQTLRFNLPVKKSSSIIDCTQSIHAIAQILIDDMNMFFLNPHDKDISDFFDEARMQPTYMGLMKLPDGLSKEESRDE